MKLWSCYKLIFIVILAFKRSFISLVFKIFTKTVDVMYISIQSKLKLLFKVSSFYYEITIYKFINCNVAFFKNRAKLFFIKIQIQFIYKVTITV